MTILLSPFCSVPSLILSADDLASYLRKLKQPGKIAQTSSTTATVSTCRTFSHPSACYYRWTTQAPVWSQSLYLHSRSHPLCLLKNIASAILPHPYIPNCHPLEANSYPHTNVYFSCLFLTPLPLPATVSFLCSSFKQNWKKSYIFTASNFAPLYWN